MSDATGANRGPSQYQPGQSGNPKGRPKGARNKLGEDFIQALGDDWAAHGKGVLETVRKDRPQDYLKVVASLVPRQIELKRDLFDGMDLASLASFVDAVKAEMEGAEDSEPDAEAGEHAVH